MLRDVELHDASQICAIYNPYIANTTVTFEEVLVTEADIQARMKTVAGTGLPWVVYVEADQVLGYAYAHRWQVRSAYRCTVESSVYVDQNLTGKGLGTQLYQALLDRLESTTAHTIVGSIALPNLPSIALHEKLGFQKVAHFKEVGWKFGQWIDVGYWQRPIG